MKYTPVKHLRFDFIPKVIQKTFMFSWLITIVILLISLIYYFIAQPQLPIFYSLARKSDQLLSKEFLFLFPTISFFMNLSHLFIIIFLKKYSVLMLKLFIATTTTLQIIFLLSLVRIVLITI